MAWFNVWDGLKNKTCRYLLQRYLGQFLEEKLNLEQLKVELYNGKATVRNVSLRVHALNELFEAQGWAVEVISGHIGVLTVTVPWNSLMTNDSSIQVSDVSITLRPIRRQHVATSMLESMWSSVSSSMQLAEECMKQNDDESDGILELPTNAIAGLEKFAETIDNVLNRIKAHFVNISVRLEYPSSDESKGIAVVFNIHELNYKNETGCEINFQNPEPYFNMEPNNVSNFATPARDTINRLPTFAKHNIVLNELSLFTNEFMINKNDSGLQATHYCKFNKNNSCEFDGCGSKIIPMLKIQGHWKIQIKMKQSEEISGPKICLDVELGSIYTFLTPRQIHLLLKLINAFEEDEPSKMSDLKKDTTAKNASSNQSTVNRRSQMTGILGNHGNWGDDFEETVTSLTPDNSCFQHSITKNDRCCESLNSSMSSSNVSSKFQRKIPNMESSSDILKFNFRVASFLCIVLHEDILFESTVYMTNSPLNEKSQVDMLNVADTFFTSLIGEASNAAEKPSNLSLQNNHIYFRVAPVLSEGIQQRNKQILLLKFSLTATQLDLCEVLDEIVTPLICFDRIENCLEGYHKRPEIDMTFRSTFPCNMKESASTALNITVEKGTLEMDISIYDRLSGLFGSSPFATQFSSFYANKSKGIDEITESGVLKKSSAEIKITSRSLDVKLRFPIADARPLHDANRVPWWKQNIRTEFLLFKILQIRANLTFNILEIVADQIDAFFCTNNFDAEIHVAKICSTKIQQCSPNDPSIDFPKVTIEMPSHHRLTNFIKNCFDNEYKDQVDNYTISNKFNIPLRTSRVCRQTDSTKRDIEDESETVILPGERHEINSFCDLTMKTSVLQIKMNLPVADILFESKQLYELIYNRLNTDLFMWEPSSGNLKNTSQHDCLQSFHNLININMMDSMYIPSTSPQDPYESLEEKNYKNRLKSNNHRNKEFVSHSDDNSKIKSSENFSEIDASESIYFSAHENNRTDVKRKIHKIMPSDCSIEIVIGKGSLAFFVPVRDVENHIIPNHLGKFDIRVKSLKVFSVNGHRSDENNSNLCIQLNDIEVYHCGLVPVNSLTTRFDLSGNVADYMQSTFYKVPNGLTKGKVTESENREMVTIVIEIKKLPDQKIKRLKITTGIQKLTLRHHTTLSTHTWLNQLIDFLDIPDYPIEGYQPYGVITELQLHLWDCAIDYRPKNFSYRSVIEIGSFIVSSNLISSVSGCNFRFFAEECILSLAPFNCIISDNQNNKITVIQSINLVPVLDVGFFDISLRLSDIPTEKCPKIDFRCSIHDVHIRTCSDSGSALAQLIAYIANDSEATYSPDNNESTTSVYSDADILSSNNSDTCHEVHKTQQERINLMMAEAVQETITSSEYSVTKCAQSHLNDRGIEVFYFPDENKNPSVGQTNVYEDIESKNELRDILNFESNVMLTTYDVKSDIEDTLPQIKADLGVIQNKKSSENGENALRHEDDYCVIAEEEKSFMYHCGIQNFEISDDPLRIVDNHFCLPTSKPDLLRSPENFPMAVLRYTLCEMTLTWHMYGGKDFLDSDSEAKESNLKTANSQMSDAYKYGVSYSHGSQDVKFTKKPKDKLTWKTVGGPERNHEILVEMQFSKIRLSHEVYPTFTSQASRQVLLISEIEIRDRLQSSDINKFLYHPNMTNLSNKNAQHMVVIKALHVRPNAEQCSAQECSLRISLLPLRLHIDQDTLIFLAEYLTNLGDSSNSVNVNVENNTSFNKPSTSIQQMQVPVMTVDELPEAVQDLRVRRLVETNINILMDDDKLKEKEKLNVNTHASTMVEESSPIYFREVIFSPEVSICFDYHGHRIELSRGPIAGLLMGLGQLRCSEIRLKKLAYRRGFLGIEKLLTYLCKEWLKDIKRNQLPKILSGVGPTNAIVQLFQGIYDLFWLPIEQYQKDGRIMRGIQLGAQSFTARTALAALEITSRLIQLLQFTAETTFDMVAPGPSVRRNRNVRKGKRKRPQRPRDIREGVTNAYLIVKEGINNSANTLIETAVSEHDQKGYTGAVGAVMRQIPQLVVCPAVLATQATTNILGGVKSSLVPEAKIEAREKWKDDSN